MPAEITSSYDERTRLMTWRVGILAFAIMLSGATAPAIRDAVGGRDGYAVMGVAVAVLLVVGGGRAPTSAPGTRRSARRWPTRRELRDQLRIVAGARDFRLLLTTFVVQALGVGAMLAGVDYMSRYVLGDKGAATILFVCFVGPALLLTPVWARIGARVGKKRGYVAASLVLALGALLLVGARSEPSAVRVRGDSAGRGRLCRCAGLPVGDAAGRGRGGRPSYRTEPGRRLHRRLDGGRDARPGAGAGAVRAGARPGRLRLVHHR